MKFPWQRSYTTQHCLLTDILNWFSPTSRYERLGICSTVPTSRCPRACRSLRVFSRFSRFSGLESCELVSNFKSTMQSAQLFKVLCFKLRTQGQVGKNVYSSLFPPPPPPPRPSILWFWIICVDQHFTYFTIPMYEYPLMLFISPSSPNWGKGAVEIEGLKGLTPMDKDGYLIC